MAQLYVGCSLTHASEEFKASVEALKQELRAHGHDVFDFVGLVNGTSKDVYEWDIHHCVGDADMVIGICDKPSIGLGWEMCRSLSLGKPTLAVAHQDAHVSRLILGADEVEPNFHFKRYNDMKQDIPAMVAELLAAKPAA